MAHLREDIINQLLETMSTAKRSMHNQMQDFARECPISGPQVELLAAIKQMQPVSFRALADQQHLTPGAVSQIVEVLEQMQFVSRQALPEDRRTHLLSITTRGEKQLVVTEARRRHVMHELLANLSTEELETWLHIQRKIISTLAEKP